jgi:Response regulator of the LytR/AlgR family
MNVIIVEDEFLAIEELEYALHNVAPYISVVAKAHSVSEAVEIIPNTKHDLIFMDVHLGDGYSFDIFSMVDIQVPVIFITAYDTYAIKAFKNKGLDYLLKPFSPLELKESINKLNLFSNISNSTPSIDDIKIQERFLVNIGARIISIQASDIAYFMADGKFVYISTFSRNNYIVEQTLSSFLLKLNPDKFFKINRKFIINYNSIVEMYKFSQNRIKVKLKPEPSGNDDVLVSSDRVILFKNG